MALETLLNTIQVTLSPGQSVSLPHGLVDRPGSNSTSDVGLVPNIVLPDRATAIGVVGTPDQISVTFSNTGDVDETANFLCWQTHTLVGEEGTLYWRGLGGDIEPTEDFNIFVDTTGSDSNPGTLESPVLTLKGALDRIPNGFWNSKNVSITFAQGVPGAPKVYNVSPSGNLFVQGPGGPVGTREDFNDLVTSALNIKGGWMSAQFGGNTLGELPVTGFDFGDFQTRVNMTVTLPGSVAGVGVNDFYGRTLAVYLDDGSGNLVFTERRRITGNDAQVGDSVKLYLNFAPFSEFGGRPTGPDRVIIEENSVQINYGQMQWFVGANQATIYASGIHWQAALDDSLFLVANYTEFHSLGSEFNLSSLSSSSATVFGLQNHGAVRDEIPNDPFTDFSGAYYHGGNYDQTLSLISSNTSSPTITLRDMFVIAGDLSVCEVAFVNALDSQINSFEEAHMDFFGIPGFALSYYDNTQMFYDNRTQARVVGSFFANNPAGKAIITLSGASQLSGDGLRGTAAAPGNNLGHGISTQNMSVASISTDTDLGGAEGDLLIGADDKTYAQIDANTPQGWSEMYTQGADRAPTLNRIARTV